MEIIHSIEYDESPVCESPIYCHGELLRTIQMSGLFKDSKTFVDKKLKKAPGQVAKGFDDLLQENNSEISQEKLEKFLEDNFDDEGLEIEASPPKDWSQVPPFTLNLKSAQLRGLAKRINRLWMKLNRKIISDVEERQALYSIIYVPNDFVVPGGRFREFYYWDTYWIIKSLLHCGMTVTVRGMIENFFYIINKYGIIPNGGRIYYIKRSQPPILSLMVNDYIKHSGNTDFLNQAIGPLSKEIDFWEQNRSINVKYLGHEFIMFRYGTSGTGPRPESFKEDFELVSNAPDKDKERMYYDLKAGAESGWDYSSRWFINESGDISSEIMDINTSSIIPVDLNCFMFLCYKNLSNFYSRLGNHEKAKELIVKATCLRLAIHIVLYDEEEKIWFDYDLKNEKKRKYYFLSNITPIWAECYPLDVSPEVAGQNVINYLRRVGALNYKGGVPTSMVNSGQQWDFPNAWPPLQHMLIVGLMNTGHKNWAQNLARLYTDSTMFSCSEDDEACKIFEKYSVVDRGTAGGGGEYEVQEGFGWTNGVIIDLIVMFKDDLLVDHSNAIEDAQPTKDDVISVFDVSSEKSHPLRSNAWEKIKKAYYSRKL